MYENLINETAVNSSTFMGPWRRIKNMYGTIAGITWILFQWKWRTTAYFCCRFLDPLYKNRRRICYKLREIIPFNVRPPHLCSLPLTLLNWQLVPSILRKNSELNYIFILQAAQFRTQGCYLQKYGKTSTYRYHTYIVIKFLICYTGRLTRRMLRFRN